MTDNLSTIRQALELLRDGRGISIRRDVTAALAACAALEAERRTAEHDANRAWDRVAALEAERLTPEEARLARYAVRRLPTDSTDWANTMAKLERRAGD